MTKQKLILIRGIPGSGKTTLAKQMDAELVEADMFFIDKNGEYMFAQERLRDAHLWCQLETKRLLYAGYSVVVANTFIKRWEIKFYAKLADKMGIPVDIIEATGNYASIHDVPEEKIRSMKAQFEELSD
ncbi:AAA family ATPase [Vibrio albus]|uniref:AAA family ATPase n=1 Tax=Vibrio albus TaxID=2200953 RepID=A0A2U3BBD7_9VIBR|nr:AAA family ATPase [Vibrio albus]PWI34112.1 AAA family ATPase [Vibrio albus]